VSGSSDGLAVSQRQLLLVLRDEPLDVDQLAARVGATRTAVAAELQTLIDAGLVHAVTVSWSGPQAWGLTVKGRSRTATGGES
jgi:predicted ArsR family transcriptional regulator